MVKAKIAVITGVGGNAIRLSSFFKSCGFDTLECSNPADLPDNVWLAIPGVTNTISQIKNLEKQGWAYYILNNPTQKIIAICSGFQALGLEVEEQNEILAGLGIIKSNVSPISTTDLPNIGWRDLTFTSTDAIYGKVYFSHSDCYLDNTELHERFKVIYSRTNKNESFIAGLISDRIVGLQFHPEVSGDNGKKIMKYFLKSVALCE